MAKYATSQVVFVPRPSLEHEGGLTIIAVLLIVYVDSGLFIVTSTIYRDALYINMSHENCTQATNMCQSLFTLLEGLNLNYSKA
jgi:hypothetical protein